MTAIEDAQRYHNECAKVPRAALNLLFLPETGWGGFPDQNWLGLLTLFSRRGLLSRMGKLRLQRQTR
jgi:hypothetical protein